MSESDPPRRPQGPLEFDPDRMEFLPPEPEPQPDEDYGGLGTSDVTREVLPDEQKTSWRGRLLALTGLGVLGALVVNAVVYVQNLLGDQPILGLPFALFITLAMVSLLGWLFAQWWQTHKLKGREEMRREAERLIGSELHGEATPLIAKVELSLKDTPGTNKGVERYRKLRGDALNDAELLMLFERTALSPVDERAKRIVLECARDVGLLTALSPLGLLDGVLVMWRNTIMLRAISACYGMRLGPAATFRLLRKCLRNAAIAGVADIVSHAAVEHVGASLATMVSARVGQGLGNALLSARLGIEAMRQTRPLPFTAEDPPRLKHIREAVFDAMTEAVKAKAGQPRN